MGEAKSTTLQAKRREEKEKKEERFFSPENFRGAKRNERKKRRTCKKIVVAGGGEDASRAQRHKQRSPETNLEASESGGYLLSPDAISAVPSAMLCVGGSAASPRHAPVSAHTARPTLSELPTADTARVSEAGLTTPKHRLYRPTA